MKKFSEFCDKHLVHYWRKWWKMYSIRADLVPLAFIGAWNILPSEWQSEIPVTWLLWLACAGFVLGFAGSLMKQKGLEDGN